MSLNTSASFGIRVVRRPVLGQIRNRISGFSRSDISLNSRGWVGDEKKIKLLDVVLRNQQTLKEMCSNKVKQIVRKWIFIWRWLNVDCKRCNEWWSSVKTEYWSSVLYKMFTMFNLVYKTVTVKFSGWQILWQVYYHATCDNQPIPHSQYP